MLDSVVSFDVSTRVRELELSITRRLREALRPHIAGPDTLETATRDALIVAREYGNSLQAIHRRAEVRSEYGE